MIRQQKIGKYQNSSTHHHERISLFFFSSQGSDVGTQYRSVILYHDSIQQKEAEMFKAHLTDENVYKDPIVTEILSIESHPFYPAEEYHQNYFNRNPNQGYCSTIVKSKIDKFLNKFPDLVKNQI